MLLSFYTVTQVCFLQCPKEAAHYSSNIVLRSTKRRSFTVSHRPLSVYMSVCGDLNRIQCKHAYDSRIGNDVTRILSDKGQYWCALKKYTTWSRDSRRVTWYVDCWMPPVSGRLPSRPHARAHTAILHIITWTTRTHTKEERQLRGSNETAAAMIIIFVPFTCLLCFLPEWLLVYLDRRKEVIDWCVVNEENFNVRHCVRWSLKIWCQHQDCSVHWL